MLLTNLLCLMTSVNASEPKVLESRSFTVGALRLSVKETGIAEVFFKNDLVMTIPTFDALKNIDPTFGKEAVAQISDTPIGVGGKSIAIRCSQLPKSVKTFTEKVEMRTDNSVVVKIEIESNSSTFPKCDVPVGTLNPVLFNASTWSAECTNYTYPKGAFDLTTGPEPSLLIVDNFWTLDIKSQSVRLRVAPSQTSSDLKWKSGTDKSRANSRNSTDFRYELKTSDDNAVRKTIRFDFSVLNQQP